MNRSWQKQKALYAPYLLLVLSWFPISGAMQVSIGFLFIAIVLLIITQSVDISWPDTIFFAVFFAQTALYSALHTDTGWINPLVGLIAYSGLAVFCIRAKEFQQIIKYFIIGVAIITIFEGLLGVGQVIYAQEGQIIFTHSAAGDRAVGTTLVTTNSNVYAAKMFYQTLLLLLAWIYSLKNNLFLSIKARWLLLVSVVCGSFGLIFASAAAFYLINFAVIIVSYSIATVHNVLRRQSILWRELLILTIWMISVMGFITNLQPSNATILSQRLSALGQVPTTINYGDNPTLFKVYFLQHIVQLDLLDSPQTALLGYGLGRHSSRAAMILSGSFLLHHPSWLPISMSEETSQLVNQYWTPEIKRIVRGTHLALPAGSAQGMLLEFGILGLIGLLGYILSLFVRISRSIRESRSDFQKFLLLRLPLFLLGVGAASVYFFWLEYPPVISFIGLLFAITLANSEVMQESA